MQVCCVANANEMVINKMPLLAQFFFRNASLIMKYNILNGSIIVEQNRGTNFRMSVMIHGTVFST